MLSFSGFQRAFFRMFRCSFIALGVMPNRLLGVGCSAVGRVRSDGMSPTVWPPCRQVIARSSRNLTHVRLCLMSGRRATDKHASVFDCGHINIGYSTAVKTEAIRYVVQ